MRALGRGSKTAESFFGALTPPPAPVVVPYVGPGDVVAGATTWWGLRAYTSASIGMNVVRLREDGGNTESDFSTITGGGLNLIAITAFKGGANLFVVKLYDQTGNGNDLSQTTAAFQPAFLLSGLGTLPIISGNGSYKMSTSTTPTINQALTVSAVAMSSVGIRNSISGTADDTGFQVGFDLTGANTPFIFAGSTATGAGNDNLWHALQYVTDGASSDVNIDGTVNTGNAGPAGASGNIWFMVEASGGNFLRGAITEAGYWSFAFSATNSTDMSDNQHTYWGF